MNENNFHDKDFAQKKEKKGKKPPESLPENTKF